MTFRKSGARISFGLQKVKDFRRRKELARVRVEEEREDSFTEGTKEATQGCKGGRNEERDRCD